MTTLLASRRLAYFIGTLLPLVSVVHAETFIGRVVQVADGDTITLLDSANVQHRIRLAGIDAPEKRQAFGNASKKYLSALAFGKTAEADCHKQDKYKRQICIVKVDGRDVGFAQLGAGLAWVYRKYVIELGPSLQIDYRTAEERAARNKLGLWQERDSVPPWDWRKREKQSGSRHP